jgi:hypothetical protein
MGCRRRGGALSQNESTRSGPPAASINFSNFLGVPLLRSGASLRPVPRRAQRTRSSGWWTLSPARGGSAGRVLAVDGGGLLGRICRRRAGPTGSTGDALAAGTE